MVFMRLVFRGDASPQIGSGHMMRLSSIAEESISRGIESWMVGDIVGIPWLMDHVSNLGFSKVLPASTFAETVSLDNILVLDSYTLATNSPELLRSRWRRFVLIADEVTPHFDADLLFHPGLDGSWFDGKQENFRFGPSYIPLRKSIRQTAINNDSVLKNIVIFGGGTDYFEFAHTIAEAIAHFPDFDSAQIYSNKLHDFAALDPRFQVKPFGLGIDRDIQKSDLVFTTASTSSLEVIARGIPLGVACSVENQVNYYQSMSDLGFACPVGERLKENKWVLNHDNIERLMGDSVFRKSLSNRCYGFIDLLGSKRIIDDVISFSD